MHSYKVAQVDAQGNLLSEVPVAAQNYNAALRELSDVVTGTHKIVVFNDEGDIAGEIGVDFWRQRVRRR